MLIARAHRALHPTLLGHARQRHSVLGHQALSPRISGAEHFSSLDTHADSRPRWPGLRGHAHLLAASMLGGAQRAMLRPAAQAIVAGLGTAGAELLPYPAQIVLEGQRPISCIDAGLSAPRPRPWQTSALAARLGAAVGLALRVVVAALGALQGASAYIWQQLRGREIAHGPMLSPLWLPDAAALDARAAATIAALVARTLKPAPDAMPDATWLNAHARAAQAGSDAKRVASLASAVRLARAELRNHAESMAGPTRDILEGRRLDRLDVWTAEARAEKQEEWNRLEAPLSLRKQHQPPWPWLDDDDRSPLGETSVCVQVAADVAPWQRALVRPLLSQRTLLRLLHPPVHPNPEAQPGEPGTTGRPGPWVLRDRRQPQYVQQAPAEARWRVGRGEAPDALVLDGLIAWPQMPRLVLADGTDRADGPEDTQLQPGLRLWARLELRATPTACGAGGTLQQVRARLHVDASNTVAMGPFGLPTQACPPGP